MKFCALSRRRAIAWYASHRVLQAYGTNRNSGGYPEADVARGTFEDSFHGRLPKLRSFADAVRPNAIASLPGHPATACRAESVTRLARRAMAQMPPEYEI